MEFLKNNKLFSFKIGEKNAWDMNYKTETTESDNQLTTVYYFENGLKVTNIAKKYDKFGAYEWVNYFENTSDSIGEILSEIWDCDYTFPIEHEDDRKWTAYFPDASAATKIYAPTGSNWSSREFYCGYVDELVGNNRKRHILPGETKVYSASNGRSSEEYAPFFNVCKNNKGYCFAIGWSGQWNCSISRTNDSLTFKSKVEDTYFRLHPNECIRTSSIVIMPYTGDFTTAQNQWRRLVKEVFSPLGKEGRPQYAPISAMLWGGMRTEEALEKLKLITENDIPVDCIWMDAGWYGIDTKPSPDEFEGDWGSHTGDFRVSPLIHPNGLKDFTKAVHDSGRKFLLWFEPERVIYTSPIVSEHPEYFLIADNPADWNRLLNLGNPAACEYCYNMLSEKIEDLGIDCLRIDFNFSPLAYWRCNDAADRKGMTEIKYINGFYKLWDRLLEKFPHLLIDDCASGGRRIDIETLRRSVPLWRSDFQCPANSDIDILQVHGQCFNTWLPYSGTGAGRDCDEYRIRSAYGAGSGIGYWYNSKCKCDSPEELAFAKKHMTELNLVRPYFSEDFYPLTEVNSNLDTWCANQFNRPSEKDGIIQIFRRERSPFESANFKLHGLEENTDYLFTDIDGGEFTLNGKTLMEDGFKAEIKEKRKAKIFFYKAK